MLNLACFLKYLLKITKICDRLISPFKKIQGDNMKLAKLSLAAIVVAGLASSSFAADTLADAFKNGKVNGELRAWYWDHDTGVAATSADIFNTGLILGYVTDSFYGFNIGATMQSNFAPFADVDAKNNFDGDQYGSGAVLSEAYIGYKMKNTTVKIGRQFIATPLVGGSGSRMVKESFEGATIVNTDLPATTLIAGYVNKFQGRTTGAYDATLNGDSSVGTFTKAADFTTAPDAYFDGAYTAAVINKSVDNLTLTAQYARVNDYNPIAGAFAAATGDVDVWYTEANYVLPLSSFKLGFDVNYRGSKTASALDAANYEGTLLAARISLIDLAGFGAAFAYSTTDKSDAVVAGMGNGPTAYTAPLIDGGAKPFTNNTDAYKFSVSYDFSKVGVAGLKAGADYFAINQDDAVDPDYKGYSLNATYDVAAVKGLGLVAQYETLETKTSGGVKSDLDRMRFMANYKF